MNIVPADIVYDIETFPNVFTFFGVNALTGQEFSFEISEFVDQTEEFMNFLTGLTLDGSRMVGFNNVGFDYPVIHYIYESKIKLPVNEIYKKAMAIIQNQDVRTTYTVPHFKEVVPQVDLFKIHHFDNNSRRTSLKALEIYMRSESIQDLPFDPGTVLNPSQIETLKKYNKHDVFQTLKFYKQSLKQIAFREDLTKKLNLNFMNSSDAKIGKMIFIQRLEEEKQGICYVKINGKKEPRQTKRDTIDLAKIILPKISFETPEFRKIHYFFKSKKITKTKGTFKDVNTTFRDISFVFGLGGIHGSVQNKWFHETTDYIIEDWDISSYYPNLSITNKFYPQHLGETFCKIYEDLYEERKKYPKGTAENDMLKLALNGVFGDSNNAYSPFYDPQYTMSITVNGQLLLAMICEGLMLCEDIQLIQVNTDGLTLYYPKELMGWVREMMDWFQGFTGLLMERQTFKSMFVRDVNNYLVNVGDGKVKRKGAYEYDVKNYQDPSALIIPKAAEAYLINSTPIDEFIECADDLLDFVWRAKISRPGFLLHGDEQLQNTSRYYVSNHGEKLTFNRPPTAPEGTFKRKPGISDAYYEMVKREVGEVWDERINTKNKSVHAWRRTVVHDGRPVTICNDLATADFSDIDYDFYIEEARKLTDVFNGR